MTQTAVFVIQVRQALEDQTKRAKVLASITALKKLCNHPKVLTFLCSLIEYIYICNEGTFQFLMFVGKRVH